VGWVLQVLLVIGFACGFLAEPGAAQEGQAWLEVTAPRDARSSTTLPLIEVKGRASARQRRGHDLAIVLDLSDSTVLSSGVDLDSDGVDGGTDPELLAWLTEQPGVRGALVDRLREVDLDDSILMAELSAAEALIQRLDPSVFRIGIVVFSDSARIVAPLGSPRGRLTSSLRDIRGSFFRDLRGTNFGDAIQTAHALLTPDPGESGDGRPSREIRERSILFLSDGAPTLPVHADRAQVHALQAARAAAAAGIRLYSFALGREAEEALEVYRRMAILSGGRFEKIARPADAITRLRRVDLADLNELRVVNRSSGRPARALRVFPDGSFDGFVELAPGENHVVFMATARDGAEVSVAREVTCLSDPSGNGDGEGPDRERIRALLQELRRRTRETALWAEVEKGRSAQRLELQITPEAPRPPDRVE
jgi:hypothetical protein